MNATDQLEEWVKGHSIHNIERDECCPDFSCCNNKMKTPKETKERFARAVKEDDEKTQLEMLGMFLGQAAKTFGKNVYIAGLETPESEQ